MKKLLEIVDNLNSLKLFTLLFKFISINRDILSKPFKDEDLTERKIF